MIKKFMILILLPLLVSEPFGMMAQQRIIKHAGNIHEKAFTVDSHTDTPLRLTRKGFDISKRNDVFENSSRVDFPRMKEGGLDAAFFAVFVGQGERNPEGNRKAKEKADMIFDSIFSAVGRNPDIAGIATTPTEGIQLSEAGKRAIFIGIENGYPIGNDLSLIEYFNKRGARYITLCHTKNNDICDSSNDTAVFGGLSPFGEQVVAEMNRIGMMIDVSHASDSSFRDVVRLSAAPVIASHSSARAICDDPRNLDDDMLRAIAANGGVVQVCILSDYIKKLDRNPQRDSARREFRVKYGNWDSIPESKLELAIREWYSIDRIYPPNLATVSDAVDHIDHIVKVAGIDHVGIGTDFDGGGALKDCYDVSQMPNITIELVKRGYTDEDIRKIWGGNLMRVMNEVAKKADQKIKNTKS